MNTKVIRLLLIILAVLCAAALAVAFQLNAVNKSLRADIEFKTNEFETEKTNLNKQLSSLADTKKKLDLQFADLKAKFDALSQDNDALKGKFDLVTKERASLVERVTGLASEKKALEEEVVKLKKSGGMSDYASAPSSTSSGDDAYWAQVLREKAALEIQTKNLNAQVSDLQLKLSTAMEEGRKIDLQLKTVIETRRDMERKLVYNEKLSQTLSEDLVREKRDKKTMSEQTESLRNENFELKSRLMALGDKKTSLEGKLVDIQQEREILAKRLQELDQLLQDRVDSIIEVKNDLKAARTEAKKASVKDSRVVQLAPIIVKASDESAPQGGGPRSGPVSGQVLAVNEENNFVIVDAGEQDGVHVGQLFTVSRDGQKIASLEVIQTRKEISAADIKSVSAGTKIKIGDMVN
jgi:chromosome segregation ATPase